MRCLARWLLILITTGAAWADLPPSVAIPPGASVGIYAAYVTDGRKLLAHNENLLLTPASVQKLLTSAAAFERLGPKYTFVTTLARSKGVLRIKAGGDPLLTSEQLLYAARRLHPQKDAAIEFDVSRYDKERYGPGWQLDDLAYYYQPPIFAFALDRNQIEMFADPTDPPRFWLDPEPPYVELTSQAKLGLGELLVGRLMDSDDFTVTGMLDPNTPSGKMVQGLAIVDPMRYAEWRIRTDPNSSTNFVGRMRIQSSPLSAIVHRLNQKSDNLIAEMLCKELGYLAHGIGTWKGGAQQLTKFAIQAGCDPKGLNVADGSGLSRYNAITAKNVVTLLRYAGKRTWYSTYLTSLPPRGKTGSMQGVFNLAGYLTGRSGKRIAFSILVNHADEDDAKRVQNAVRSWLTNDGEALRWSKRGTRRPTSSSRARKGR